MNAPVLDHKIAKQPAGLTAAPQLPATAVPLAISLPGDAATSDLRITRLTHASVLIQWGDEALLTDPWFSQKPLYHHGESLPLGIAQLPRLTGVLSSMNHYDHFDITTFAAYRDRDVPLVTIAGSPQTEAARESGFRNVAPLMAGHSIRLGSATLHAFAANSFAPSAFRYEQAYVIEVAGRTILFCAHFLRPAAVAQVKARFPRIDLALLGVNGLRIKPLLGRQLSMDPDDAAVVCSQLSVSAAVPIHYAFNGGWISSTFLLTHKGTPERFAEEVRRIAPRTSVITLSPGQPLILRA